MKIIHLNIKNIEEINDDINLCLGFFDGVHLGHLKLIKKAKRCKGKLGVLSFEFSPQGGKSLKLITPIEDKVKIFEKLGVDYLFLLKVDKDLMDTVYIDFINNCLNKLHPKSLILGEDFTFGKNRVGTRFVLKDLFKCHIIDLEEKHGKKISSSTIRELIEDGKIEIANKLLGRPFSVTNNAQKGFGKGRTLGFNTVNVPFGDEYVVPKFGVYLTSNLINGKWYYGCTNVGVHPTLNELDKPIIEANLLNYDSYEEIKNPVTVKFIKFIRPEKHFKTVEELQKQVLGDIQSLKKSLHIK